MNLIFPSPPSNRYSSLWSWPQSSTLMCMWATHGSKLTARILWACSVWIIPDRFGSACIAPRRNLTVSVRMRRSSLFKYGSSSTVPGIPGAVFLSGCPDRQLAIGFPDSLPDFFCPVSFSGHNPISLFSGCPDRQFATGFPDSSPDFFCPVSLSGHNPIPLFSGCPDRQFATGFPDSSPDYSRPVLVAMWRWTILQSAVCIRCPTRPRLPFQGSWQKSLIFD